MTAPPEKKKLKKHIYFAYLTNSTKDIYKLNYLCLFTACRFAMSCNVSWYHKPLGIKKETLTTEAISKKAHNQEINSRNSGTFYYHLILVSQSVLEVFLHIMSGRG